MHPMQPGKNGFPRLMHHKDKPPVVVSDVEGMVKAQASGHTSTTYIHQEYPRTVYHKSGSMKLVKNDQEFAKLGKGWQKLPFRDDELEGAAPLPSTEHMALADENAKLKAQLAEMQAAAPVVGAKA